VVKIDVRVVKNDAKRRNKISGAAAPEQMPVSIEAQSVIVDVVEGFCPLCEVELIRHAEMACCPCGGCSYRIDGLSLLMGSCADHPAKDCEHWQAIWELRNSSLG